MVLHGRATSLLAFIPCYCNLRSVCIPLVSNFKCTADVVLQLELEQQAKETAEREGQSLMRSLEAERAKVDAVRAEATASAEAFEAERAAKWAAAEEARQLQQDLEAARESLRRER